MNNKVHGFAIFTDKNSEELAGEWMHDLLVKKL